MVVVVGIVSNTPLPLSLTAGICPPPPTTIYHHHPPLQWFHPNISGPDAAVALKSCGYDGAFLVRRSKSSPTDFTLCCK